MADAAVWITGTGPDKQLNFRLPTGGKGDKGDKGDKGADGSNVLPTDTAIANAINNSASQARGALNATFDPKLPAALGRLHAAITRRNLEPVIMVGAGSSSTEGYAASTPANRWLNKFATALQSAYPLTSGVAQPATRLLSEAVATPPSANGIQFINAGVGSTNSATYLTSTTGPQVAALNPDVIFHMVGSNDFAGNMAIATYKANLTARLDQLDADATSEILHVFVHSFEQAGANVTDGTLHTWAEYGNAAREIADARPNNVMFVDISRFFEPLDPFGTDPYGLGHTDNVHMLDGGHALMAELVRSELRLSGSGSGSSGGAAVIVINSATAVNNGADVLVVDAFDRANSTSSLGVADTGETWTAAAGTWGISSGRAYAFVGNAVAIADAGQANVSVQCDVTVPSASTSGILARGTAATERVVLYYDQPSGELRLGITTASATAVRGSYVHGLTAGSTSKLRLEVIGTAVTAYLNDALVISYTLTGTENTALTGTGVGLRQGTSGSATTNFDNLLVTKAA